jgi:hypothetical protein
MSACCGSPKARRTAAWARRCRDVGAWAAPSLALALMPKCPMCVVAYVAIATGLGISISTAAYLRFGLIGVCIAALMYLAWRKVRIVLGSARRA